jgi:hypothetical protein
MHELLALFVLQEFLNVVLNKSVCTACVLMACVIALMAGPAFGAIRSLESPLLKFPLRHQPRLHLLCFEM